jgi:hypothetical protein
MYKTHEELENTFRRWILSGVIVFGLLFLVLIIRQSFCQPAQYKSWSGKSYYSSTQDKDGRQIFEFKFSPTQENGADADKNKADTNHLVAWWCKEEFKVTDLLIALFTYCTVCVGLFAMRYTDITTRRNERAYLIGGALTDSPRAKPSRTASKIICCGPNTNTSKNRDE